MPAFTSVLCALDSSAVAPRVLRHAAGLARVCGARLTLIKVTGRERGQAEAYLAGLLRDHVPAGALAEPPVVRVVQLALGKPVDAIISQARAGADLIVAGTHATAGLSRWLLGSTSQALLAETPCAVLLVPPGHFDIVTLSGAGATLVPGTVLAAVDLDEQNAAQLAVAGELATLAGQPLALMTVAGDGMSDADAAAALTARSRDAGPAPVARVLVRRGKVAEAIDLAAVDEQAGLVVMGLRARGAGTPGAIATAVLRSKDAVVLAVPGRS